MGRNTWAEKLQDLASFDMHITLSRVDGCCAHDTLPAFYKQDFNGACALRGKYCPMIVRAIDGCFLGHPLFPPAKKNGHGNGCRQRPNSYNPKSIYRYIHIYVYGTPPPPPKDLPNSMPLETLLASFAPIVHEADLWRGNLPCISKTLNHRGLLFDSGICPASSE